MHCTVSVEIYTEEAWKPGLQITVLTGGSVAYSSFLSIFSSQVVSLNSSDLFPFILVSQMK